MDKEQKLDQQTAILAQWCESDVPFQLSKTTTNNDESQQSSQSYQQNIQNPSQQVMDTVPSVNKQPVGSNTVMLQQQSVGGIDVTNAMHKPIQQHAVQNRPQLQDNEPTLPFAQPDPLAFNQQAQSTPVTPNQNTAILSKDSPSELCSSMYLVDRAEVDGGSPVMVEPQSVSEQCTAKLDNTDGRVGSSSADEDVDRGGSSGAQGRQGASKEKEGGKGKALGGIQQVPWVAKLLNNIEQQQKGLVQGKLWNRLSGAVQHIGDGMWHKGKDAGSRQQSEEGDECSAVQFDVDGDIKDTRKRAINKAMNQYYMGSEHPVGSYSLPPLKGSSTSTLAQLSPGAIAAAFISMATQLSRSALFWFTLTSIVGLMALIMAWRAARTAKNKAQHTQLVTPVRRVATTHHAAPRAHPATHTFNDQSASTSGISEVQQSSVADQQFSQALEIVQQVECALYGRERSTQSLSARLEHLCDELRFTYDVEDTQHGAGALALAQAFKQFVGC